MLGSFTLMLVATLSTALQAKEIKTPVVIIGDLNSYGIEFCAANFSNKDEQIAYRFEPSIKAVDEENMILLSLAPGESKCQIFRPLTAGVVYRIVPIPPAFLEVRSNPDVLTKGELLEALKASNVFAQIWILGLNSERTAQAIACPTPSGVCPDVYRVIGNDPGAL
jgi:hypothetical protein